MTNTTLIFRNGIETSTLFNEVAGHQQLSVNKQNVVEYFTYGENFGSNTLFNEVSIDQPWEHICYKPQPRSLAEHGTALAKSFRKVMHDEMADDVHYLISLSGGMDSRTIAAAYRKDRDVSSFTFGPRTCRDCETAREVSETAGIDSHTEYKLNKNKVPQYFLPSVVATGGTWNIGMTFGLPIYEKLRGDVVLDGWGTDAFIGGNAMLGYKSIDGFFRKMTLFNNSELKRLLTFEFEPSTITGFNFKSADKHDHLDELVMNTHVCRNSSGYTYHNTFAEMRQPHANPDFIKIGETLPWTARYAHRAYSHFMRELSAPLAKIPYSSELMSVMEPFPLRIAGRYARRFDQRPYIDLNEWHNGNNKWSRTLNKILKIDDDYTNQDYVLGLTRLDQKLAVATFKLAVNYYELR